MWKSNEMDMGYGYFNCGTNWIVESLEWNYNDPYIIAKHDVLWYYHQILTKQLDKVRNDSNYYLWWNDDYSCILFQILELEKNQQCFSFSHDMGVFFF